MRISTKGRYALEALLDLALQDHDGFVALHGVGARRGLSENYLEQIFSDLRRGDLVVSLRGQQGGYRLSRDPSRITAGEVLRAVEGPLVPVACVSDPTGPIVDGEADDPRCPRQERCVTRLVWMRMTEAMDRAADAVTLADLIVECHADRPQELAEPDYCI
jgi:Rrf2 family transcriptional regulator, cysteine metabolism repressor